jgi:hypothetical protein
MQLGNTQHLQVGKTLNVSSNFNHLWRGERFEPQLQGPWPLQHNVTIAIDNIVETICKILLTKNIYQNTNLIYM